jgi:hypothetical protein
VFYKRTLATSKFIKQEHQFYLEEKCIVWIDGVENFKSPHWSILRQEHSALFMLLKIYLGNITLIPIIKQQEQIGND